MSQEVYFDLITAGFVPGYAFCGGPGRVFFDPDTRAFLRIEPVGGFQPETQSPVSEQPTTEASVQDSTGNGGVN